MGGALFFVCYLVFLLMCLAICICSAKATVCLLSKKTVNISFSHLKLTTYLYGYGASNICFEFLSLNARGLCSFDRRKSFFNWLFKSSANICFLQETYSTPEVENMWKKQWKGKMFFSHETNHSRGVLILVKDRLDFKLQSVKVDSEGCYILLEALIQDSPFVLLNIYI